MGVDVAIECVGLAASLNACAAGVRRRGTVVQVGLHLRPATIDAEQVVHDGFEALLQPGGQNLKILVRAG